MLEVTHLDARGRIVLPAALRARLDLKEGTALLIEVAEDGSFHLTPRHVAARALLGRAAGRGGGVETLLAMRKEDFAKEVADAQARFSP